jgi:hypothetical protein
VEQVRRRLVGLLWLYFALLILEGALRKWVFPSLSDALLIVRDPVALAIIGIAYTRGFLPVIPITRALQALFIAFCGLASLHLMLGDVSSPFVIGFGLRTYFLHPPLIFIMARVLRPHDIRQLTVVTIALAVPIALLMAVQFQSGPLDWINVGAGAGSLQIRTSGGRIRAAGPFSFISGPVHYFALTLGCLIASHMTRDRIQPLLPLMRFGGWAAVMLAAAVAGSRGLVAGLAPVVIAVVAALLIRPRLVGGVMRMAATVAAVGLVVWTFSVVREGVDVFNLRTEESGGTVNLLERSTTSYQFATTAWEDSPLLGVGIGLGTNVGSTLAGGARFQLGETEWQRVIYEAGPVLGTAYMAWRFWLLVFLIRLAKRAAAAGSVLPFALVGACASSLLIGQWGQPTTQGFSVWMAGLALAACRLPSVAQVRARRRAPVPRAPQLRRVEA